MKRGLMLMAFGKGRENTTESTFTRYLGVAPVTILAVNPSKKELEKLYNITLDKEPEYTGVSKLGDRDIKYVKIDFIVKVSPDDCDGIDLISKVTFFIRETVWYNKDNSKVQVIDKYGRTAWPTVEETKNKQIPQYSSGLASLDEDYRPCFMGEEALTNFLKVYLNIPSLMVKHNDEYKKIDNPEDAEARLEHIKDYFKGDFSELADLIKLVPNNKIKVMFGIRTVENKQYQTTYAEKVLSNRSSNYALLEKHVEEGRARNSNYYKDVEFSIDPLHEYKVVSTEFKEEDNKNVEPLEDWPF